MLDAAGNMTTIPNPKSLAAKDSMASHLHNTHARILLSTFPWTSVRRTSLPP